MAYCKPKKNGSEDPPLQEKRRRLTGGDFVQESGVWEHWTSVVRRRERRWLAAGLRGIDDHSVKSLGWAAVGAEAGLRRAMPTTPRTVREEMAERGTKMRSVLEERSGGVSWTPLSRRDKRSLVTTPSSVSPSV